jgi:hypothetical protein
MALKQTDLYKDILKIFQTKRMEPDPDNIGQLRPAPNTGAKVTLTKHMHPTAVPGPAAPATPGT